MSLQVRIVAGSLRGRKLICTAAPELRPTPDMVRQALFSILGDAVPDRLFVDIFSGSGAVGLEAVSRGASRALLIERDFRLANDIDRHITAFEVTQQAQVLRADAYGWVKRWQAPAEPVNVFISPPFADFQRRGRDLLDLVVELQTKLAPGSVVVLQGERGLDHATLPGGTDAWEARRYGRNELLIWVKGE